MTEVIPGEVVESEIQEEAPEITELSEAEQHRIKEEARKSNRASLRQLGFDFNKTYYLAGPMSGYPEYNYPMFGFVSTVLRDAGLSVESPHENPWPEGHEDMDEKDLWKEMMAASRKQLENSDGVILLRGWPQSKGARAEMRYAIMREMSIWYFDTETSQIQNHNRPTTEE